jgi:hypothetical protein
MQPGENSPESNKENRTQQDPVHAGMTGKRQAENLPGSEKQPPKLKTPNPPMTWCRARSLKIKTAVATRMTPTNLFLEVKAILVVRSLQGPGLEGDQGLLVFWVFSLNFSNSRGDNLL